MEVHSHADIAGMERRNWWYVARRRVLANLLRRYVPSVEVAVDVGCGVGSNYPVLASSAQRVIGLDISPEALAQLKVQYSETVLASVEKIPLPDASADIVLCADVLEHVDDVASVREIYRILKPGGHLFVNVPAFESLWNENDDYAHHLRRYRKGQLKALLADAGFSILQLGYWNRLFWLPVWIIGRTYKRGSKKEDLRNNLHSIPSWLDPLLIAWMRLENALGSIVPLPPGVSLVVVAQKPL
jgi:SAM-dependent methyltransferase